MEGLVNYLPHQAHNEIYIFTELCSNSFRPTQTQKFFYNISGSGNVFHTTSAGLSASASLIQLLLNDFGLVVEDPTSCISITVTTDPVTAMGTDSQLVRSNPPRLCQRMYGGLGSTFSESTSSKAMTSVFITSTTSSSRL